MILYTIMPQEWMFPVEDSAYQNQQLVTYNGVSMIVEKNENNEVKIVRLLSSDPQHYLSDQYLPGSLIQLTF
jgi:hypothetical protein